MKRKGGMNDSEGESHTQKWSNSPGYTNVSNITNSPFKTPVSAKGGRTQKAKASKEGRSCPPTPISNAGERTFPFIFIVQQHSVFCLRRFSAWKHFVHKI